jgi:hypothetical protein
MKKLILLLTLAYSISVLSQINPLNSPYFSDGAYEVEMLEDFDADPDLLIFKPVSDAGAPYPTVLFQPGANPMWGTSYIDKHSYDIYLEHLASYGYVVMIINNTSGGPNANLFKNTHNWIKTQVNSGSHWMSTYVDLDRFIVGGHSNGGMNATDVIIDRPDEIHAIFYWASYPNPGDIIGLGSQNVSNYTGKVLVMCGDEDDTSMMFLGTTNEIANNAYENRFTSASCKSWSLFDGVGHGGFGDYGNPDQPVGSIGRDSTTASIRHIFVSFLNSQFHGDNQAFNYLNQTELRPSTLLEFENTCEATGEDIEYSLTLNTSHTGAGNVYGAGDYTEGTNVSVSATANQAYIFLNWKDQYENIVSTNANFVYNMPGENMSLTAYYDVVSTTNSVKDSRVNIYPNPATSHIVIDAPGYNKIEIYDITGKLLHTGTINDKGLELNIKRFERGLYMILLKNATTTLTRKVVLQ